MEKYLEFFNLVESAITQRFAAGDVGPEAPKLIVYRSDSNEFLGYDLSDDPIENRNAIAAMLAWENCLGVGYITELTIGGVRAIVGVFHSPRELPRMIRIEIEGAGKDRRIGRIRTDFTPGPSAIIKPAFGNVDKCKDRRPHEIPERKDPRFVEGEDFDTPQVIRGAVGPTIILIPEKKTL